MVPAFLRDLAVIVAGFCAVAAALRVVAAALAG
jgi:pilus assembly protein TadC